MTDYKQKPIKFEVGKYYKTRGGRKARVVCTDALGSQPIVALVEYDVGEERPKMYKDDGSFWGNRVASEWDLVSEWVESEPPKTEKRTFYRALYLHSEGKRLSTTCWVLDKDEFLRDFGDDNLIEIEEREFEVPV